MPRRYDDEDDDDFDDDFNIRKPIRNEEVPNYLIQAIVVTLLCCWPLGIVAIAKAVQVNSLLAKGEYRQAEIASQEAKKWCWISFGLGIVANIIIYGVMFDRGDLN